MATKIDTVYVGKSLVNLVENVPATINYDEDGIAKASLTYTCKYEVAPMLVGQIRVHPDFNWLVFKTATITRQPGCLAQVKVNFEGIPDPTDDDPETENEVPTTHSLRGATSSEPIETHKNFEDIAGTSNENAKNGAVFGPKKNKQEGKFLGFNKDPANRKYGVKSYLEGGFIFSETTLEKDAGVVAANLNSLGKILEVPQGKGIGNLNAKGDFTWLLISCDVEPVGGGFKITRSWRLSGQEGWDEDIYEEA